MSATLNLTQAVAIGFGAGCWGAIAIHLVQPGEILAWLPKVLPGHPGRGPYIVQAVHKVAYDCDKCAAGQMAFWLSMLWMAPTFSFYSVVFAAVAVMSAAYLAAFFTTQIK